MRIIPNEFTKNGFQYSMIKRKQDAAIFAQKINDDIIAYEVIRIKKFPERTISGKIIEAGEYYPSTEKWGTDGFTTHDIHRANQIYESLRPLNSK